jgi:holin-like protein
MAVLLGFYGAGEALASVARLPVPGSVVGMLLLAGVLQAGWLPLDVVRPAAEFLIRIMGLLFVPPGVGLVVYFELIGREWVPITAAAIASTLSVLLVAGVMQQRMERRG